MAHNPTICHDLLKLIPRQHCPGPEREHSTGRPAMTLPVCQAVSGNPVPGRLANARGQPGRFAYDVDITGKLTHSALRLQAILSLRAPATLPLRINCLPRASHSGIHIQSKGE